MRARSVLSVCGQQHRGLLALILYPALIEPALRLRAQNAHWALAYGVFGALSLTPRRENLEFGIWNA